MSRLRRVAPAGADGGMPASGQELTPAEMGPAYWIAMGATATSVRAAGILALRTAGSAPLLAGLRPFLLGLSVVLWAFGSWWIPLLVLFGYWRTSAGATQ
jgi:hypothetical protein